MDPFCVSPDECTYLPLVLLFDGELLDSHGDEIIVFDEVIDHLEIDFLTGIPSVVRTQARGGPKRLGFLFQVFDRGHLGLSDSASTEDCLRFISCEVADICGTFFAEDGHFWCLNAAHGEA